MVNTWEKTWEKTWETKTWLIHGKKHGIKRLKPHDLSNHGDTIRITNRNEEMPCGGSRESFVLPEKWWKKYNLDRFTMEVSGMPTSEWEPVKPSEFVTVFCLILHYICIIYTWYIYIWYQSLYTYIIYHIKSYKYVYAYVGGRSKFKTYDFPYSFGGWTSTNSDCRGSTAPRLNRQNRSWQTARRAKLVTFMVSTASTGGCKTWAFPALSALLYSQKRHQRSG